MLNFRDRSFKDNIHCARAALKDNNNSAELESLKAENNSLKQDIKTLRNKTDDIEQRGRNDCLVIHGISESQNEDTNVLVCDLLKDKLGIDLVVDDLKRSHRLGPPRNQRSTRSTREKPRPIIIRFVHFHKRHKVFRSKRKLKSTGITITESSKSLRYSLYKESVKKFGNSVWTSEGRILVKTNNQIVNIVDMESLQNM